MQTIIYIDGYNFYYGLLRNTAYKWLDIVNLIKHICRIQNPSIEIITVKFFTAPVITRVATRGEIAQQSQDSYHKALVSSHAGIIEIINGFHILEKGYLPCYKKPIDKTDRVEVWRLEEKQTDVNIALHLYRDVVKQKCEQVILVSSDSDLEPALRFLKQDFSDLEIGLILPRKQPTEKKYRPANTSLSKQADWTRSYILEDELKQYQFPKKVLTRKKPAIKPEYW
jgi:uncharacterized LabA/DUF88 family protein